MLRLLDPPRRVRGHGPVRLLIPTGTFVPILALTTDTTRPNSRPVGRGQRLSGQTVSTAPRCCLHRQPAPDSTAAPGAARAGPAAKAAGPRTHRPGPSGPQRDPAATRAGRRVPRRRTHQHTCASANRRPCSARPTDCSTATSATTSPPACSPATKTAARQLAGRCLCHQIAPHQGLTAVTTHRSQTDSIRS